MSRRRPRIPASRECPNPFRAAMGLAQPRVLRQVARNAGISLFMATYDQLLDENARLRARVSQQDELLFEQQSMLVQLRSRLDKLEAQVDAQAAIIASQAATIASQATVIKQQAAKIARLTRSGKRQAAPFSKGKPKADPKKPGRKPGDDYGMQAQKNVPERVDRTIQVECPLYCLHCGAQVRLEAKVSQFQVDLPEIKPDTTEFVIHQGRCTCCGHRAQGRHSAQVSDAVTVGHVHFGPGVVGLAAHLNKICGMSYGKIATLLRTWMGLSVNRSSLCRAIARLASKASPTRDALVGKVRGSPVVTADETGWKVGGLRAWLWGFATERETVYQIERGRGFAEAAQVLGQDYSGVLIVDGWAPYRRFPEAILQTCFTHLLRRCSEILEDATAGAVRFPRAVREILERALAVRDRRDAGTITSHGVQVARGQLQARMNRLLEGNFTNPENLRFARHLRRYRNALFVFLSTDGVEATNWRGEHAMRAGIMTRKCCGGGNRTESGAETQAILMTVLRTIHQKSLDQRQIIAEILTAPIAQANMLVVGG